MLTNPGQRLTFASGIKMNLRLFLSPDSRMLEKISFHLLN
jgi:hypothetical protein